METDTNKKDRIKTSAFFMVPKSSKCAEEMQEPLDKYQLA